MSRKSVGLGNTPETAYSSYTGDTGLRSQYIVDNLMFTCSVPLQKMWPTLNRGLLRVTPKRIVALHQPSKWHPQFPTAQQQWVNCTCFYTRAAYVPSEHPVQNMIGWRKINPVHKSCWCHGAKIVIINFQTPPCPSLRRQQPNAEPIVQEILPNEWKTQHNCLIS